MQTTPARLLWRARAHLKPLDTVLLTALATNVDNHSEPNARDICLMQTPRSISTIRLAATPPQFSSQGLREADSLHVDTYY
ncbi:hypothetical protein IscW_ISCW007418 [Ixodes scapularis]|uniref:Uncharacterized protein n=1 Tax=Ixodes scapularis TaxID=6945 RepID=B7PRZ8_IXOSC|nr:hypothetical protein IscW_ISCW007418 [Ixodes scapularis]|eukprot:XP_002401477.1 hypothetical protein IscW_ISCW007418 [Ixodes scapularis]